MPAKHRSLCTILGLSMSLMLACDVSDIPGNPLLPLNPNETEVDAFNDSDVAVNLMGPGETAQPSNLVQPGGGRVVIVQFTPNGDVSFRATNDQGLFALATWTFTDSLRPEEGVGRKQGTVTFTQDNALTCTGDLFAEN